MSIAFIQNRHNSPQLSEAVRQQENIAYYTVSSVGKDITSEYIKQWAASKYPGTDKFTSWVKNVLSDDNFEAFYKYLRFPIPSSKLVNNRIAIPLKRVFHAEDSYEKYTLRDNEIEIEYNNIDQLLFKWLLSSHNDILVHDLKDVNTPIRYKVGIDKVVSIESHNDVIQKIAYTASINKEGEKINGHLYIDDSAYIFYDENEVVQLNEPHDLGECPAYWIAQNGYTSDVVRKSIFTHVVPELEEYTFLKVIQRMIDANGTMPVVTYLEAEIVDENGNRNKPNNEPPSANMEAGQSPQYNKEVQGSSSPIQAGTQLKVPLIRDKDGGIDTKLIQEFFKFHYTPVDILQFIVERLKGLEQSIIITLLGDYKEGNDSAKNELQIQGSFVSREDMLRELSSELSNIATKSNRAMLGLEYGIKNITAEKFFGSDFFLETQADIYELIIKSPNPIERRKNLIRLGQNSNKFNPDKAAREKILNMLIPFSTDKDFNIAAATIDPILFSYYNRFNYWINQFEANYTDILGFWNAYETEKPAEKLDLINNLIIQIIKDGTTEETDSTPSLV